MGLPAAGALLGADGRAKRGRLGSNRTAAAERALHIANPAASFLRIQPTISKEPNLKSRDEPGPEHGGPDEHGTAPEVVLELTPGHHNATWIT